MRTIPAKMMKSIKDWRTSRYQLQLLSSVRHFHPCDFVSHPLEKPKEKGALDRPFRKHKVKMGAAVTFVLSRYFVLGATQGSNECLVVSQTSQKEDA